MNVTLHWQVAMLKDFIFIFSFFAPSLHLWVCPPPPPPHCHPSLLTILLCVFLYKLCCFYKNYTTMFCSLSVFRLSLHTLLWLSLPLCLWFFVTKLPRMTMNLICRFFCLPLFSKQLSWRDAVTDSLAVRQLDLPGSRASLFSRKIVNLSVIFLWSFIHTDTLTHRHASPHIHTQ